MCSLTGTQTQDPWNTVPWLYRLSQPATYTSSPLNSKQFWIMTYSPAILEFVLEFQSYRARWLKFWAIFTHSPTLGAKCHMVRKMCSLTRFQPGTLWTSYRGKVQYIRRHRLFIVTGMSDKPDLLLYCSPAYTSSPLNNEQFWTMTPISN
jgi:hypothetical protein